MTTNELTVASATTLHEQLQLLERERQSAVLAGLDGNDRYMADLLSDLGATRNAYVGAAVTEIASLRAALGSPLHG